MWKDFQTNTQVQKSTAQEMNASWAGTGQRGFVPPPSEIYKVNLGGGATWDLLFPVFHLS